MKETSINIQGRAMVMDEDRAWLARRSGQLTAAGWEIVQAADTIQALAAVRTRDVDVALLRVDADEAEAMDLPDVLRLTADTPHLPVIVLAPRVGERDRCNFLDGGADEAVPDDVSPDELAARMRALMRMKLLQDQLESSRQALTASLARERALLTQLRRDNAHLLTLCSTDPLTRLYNVRHFDSILESEFKIARRYNRHLSVLTFDLDHFKLVNDNHGHPSGDYVLKEFAVILKQTVRDSDVVARTGGEEFSIILPAANRSQAVRFAERIRQAVSERKFIVFGQEIHVTTSIGLASYPEDAQITEPHMLTYFADQALLRAKQTGRDRVAAFADFDPASRHRLRKGFVAAAPDDPRTPDPALAADVRR
ncbi:MAG: GGDEF domain-containing response regulator [Planctomycetota bacterium]|jgi:diguanylate cyclase (GGDEF)-like protein